MNIYYIGNNGSRDCFLVEHFESDVEAIKYGKRAWNMRGSSLNQLCIYRMRRYTPWRINFIRQKKLSLVGPFYPRTHPHSNSVGGFTSNADTRIQIVTEFPDFDFVIGYRDQSMWFGRWLEEGKGNSDRTLIWTSKN